jgi:hypothetical protein
MKYITNPFSGSANKSSLLKLARKLTFAALVATGFSLSLSAQETKLIKPSWWIGVAGGANFNSFNSSITQPNQNLTFPEKTDGSGIGLFGYPVLEYHKPGTVAGFMLHTGYESRRGKFDETFETKLAYITFEPSIRLNLFKSPLFIYGGPRLGYNIDKRFYHWNITSSNPNPPKEVDVFSDVKNIVISTQVGLGYDITVTGKNNKSQVIISPFAAYHPSFGQSPRSVESWDVTTIRTGIAFKFGKSKQIPIPDHVIVPVVIPEETDIATQPIDETSQADNTDLSGSLYYDVKTSEAEIQQKASKAGISGITDGITADNKADLPTIDNNIVNKVGSFLKKNPTTQLTLVGTSEFCKTDGKEMAQSVGTYLKSIYGIGTSGISVKGRKVKAGHQLLSGSDDELLLLDDGNRHVIMKSQTPTLIREIGGLYPGTKSKRLFTINEAKPENSLIFTTENAKEPLSSWSLKLTDEKGVVQNFGPFFKDMVTIPTKLVLGNRDEGYFDVMISGQSKSLITISKDTTLHITKWTPPRLEKNYRFSITYAFNNPKAIRIFEKYLKNVVLPHIHPNGRVVIHGHSEFMENEDYYVKTSLNRANDVKRILEEALAKSGRYDVNFEMHGFGEDNHISLFDKTPTKKKLLWRTVIVDIADAEE